MNGEIHVSSIVVHSRPGWGGKVAAALAAMPGLEVRASSPEGKLVVVFEAESVAAIFDRIEAIRNAAGVVGAALVFHAIDGPSPEETRSQPCP
jgi:periplasmic nitrate reductase NapD